MKKYVGAISKFVYGWYINRTFIKEIRGKENMPPGNFILASNHASHIDYWLHGYVLAPRPFTYIGQVDKMTGLMGFLRDALYAYAEVIPVDRNDRESKKEAIAKAMEMLKRGYCLIVYPEGARSRDGRMREFKPGVARFHLESGAPVLPVATRGTYELMPPGGKLQKEKIVEIIIGKPMGFPLERQMAVEMDKSSPEYYKLCADVAKRVEEEVRRLLAEIPSTKSQITNNTQIPN